MCLSFQKYKLCHQWQFSCCSLEGVCARMCAYACVFHVNIKNYTQKKTFIALKTATTIDGKIATYTGDSKWITSDTARNEVRNIRKNTMRF